MKIEIKRLLRKARLVQKNRKHSTMRCPDQRVGEIQYTIQDGFELIGKVTTCKIKGSKRNDVDEKYTKGNNNAIVLILESPHIDEFDICKKSRGPAYGITGDNINKYIIEILNDALNNGIIQLKNVKTCIKYDFILINAIQYQTSLGVDTIIYRDAIFLKYWEHNKIKKDFINRLRRVIVKYGVEDVIFINGCTKGEHLDLITNHKGEITHGYLDELGYKYNKGKQTLQRFVAEEISSKGIKQYYVSHPSSWIKKSNRVLKTNI